MYVQNPPEYAALTDLTNWTALSGWGASNLRGYASDSSYVYIARGNAAVLGRVPFPVGTMTTPNVTTDAYAESLCVYGGHLYTFSDIDNRCFVSSDFGATYTPKAPYRTLGVTGSAPKAVAGPSGIAVAFSDNAGAGPVKIAYSSNGGTSWSTPANPIPASLTVAGILKTSTHFVVLAYEGQTASSPLSDGITWTAGASIVSGVSSFAVNGNTIVVCGVDGDMWQSTNNGASWQAFSGPTASDNAGVYSL